MIAIAGARMLALALAAPAVAPVTPNPGVGRGRGEILIDADAAPRPSDVGHRDVHGEARLGLGFGAVMQDPVLTLHPGVALDLTERVPLRFSLSAPIRIRMADRAPDQRGVVRQRDWDEVGDGLAILDRLHYTDALLFGEHGWVEIDVRAGELSRVQLGHGSLVRGFANSTDVDRRRSGLDAQVRVEGRLLEQPAHAELAVVVTDLSGMQILGARGAARWAGAELGLSVVGDPTAPRQLGVDPASPQAVPRTRAGRLRHVGRRGVVALGTDLSFQATDAWHYVIVPYLDMAWLPNLGGGGHLGLDAEVILGRRRRLRLGAVAEATLGSSGYDPGYFDVFYLAQRWQMQTVATPDDRPADLGQTERPKWAWVVANDLAGFGGGGSVRLAHAAGVFTELGYRVRPGPLGHTFESRVGIDLRPVALSVLAAHRGTRHGFDGARAGTLARVDVVVPVIRYLDVLASAGWLTALRGDTNVEPEPTGDTGIVTGAGFFNAGVAGKFPW